MLSDKFIYWFNLALLLLIVLIIGIGDNTYLKIKNTNLSPSTIQVSTDQFYFEFNKEVDRNLVEDNFKVTPTLQGEFSWIGKKMAYTLSEPLSYNQKYTVQILPFKNQKSSSYEFKGFSSNFSTEPRQVLYLDTSNQNSILTKYSFVTQKSTPLTPKEFFVLKYIPAKELNKIFFLATNKSDLLPDQDYFLTDLQQLYELNLESGKVKLLTTQKNFINFDFDYSEVQNRLILSGAKVSADNIIQDKGLWIANANRPNFVRFWFKTIDGDQVNFSPDGNSVVGYNQDLGFLIAPVKPNIDAIVELGSHQKFYNFTQDLSASAFTTYKQNLDDINNFITLIFPGNKKQTLFVDELTSQFDFIKFFNNSPQIAYLNKPNSTTFRLELFDYSKQIRRTLAIPNSNIEHFDISLNDQFILFELFPFQVNQNLGPSVRTFVDNFNNFIEPTGIYFVDLETKKYYKLPIQGRQPIWF